MKIILIIAAFLLSNGSSNKYYYHMHSVCSFSFNTFSEYQLELSETNKFKLFVKITDTRYDKPSKNLITGIFELSPDTLSLNIESSFSKLTTLESSIKYEVKKDELILLTKTTGFPLKLKQIGVPILDFQN